METRWTNFSCFRALGEKGVFADEKGEYGRMGILGYVLRILPPFLFSLQCQIIHQRDWPSKQITRKKNQDLRIFLASNCRTFHLCLTSTKQLT